MTEIDVREGYGGAPRRWVRGTRVEHAPTGCSGVVEGHKADLVLVWWGTANKVEFRSWVPSFELVEGTWQPGYPKAVKDGA